MFGFNKKGKEELTREYNAEKAILKEELNKERSQNELVKLKEDTQKLKKDRFKRSKTGKTLSFIGGAIKSANKYTQTQYAPVLKTKRRSKKKKRNTQYKKKKRNTQYVEEAPQKKPWDLDTSNNGSKPWDFKF